ncbi:pyocin activator PrtN family protein [Pseudomonas fluorescens]|uniref:Uncharacterized protein n=1 Tax=Pseudomonas fluorescens TaxID=294 RepID=A0A5E6ZYT5_PSEFL|nr:pyocin activator PrtN family protein [Pseudomonas fluorescens]VVN71596.1 hypothetical protein PS833_00451 [Pseudomonas fluorescens]VVP82589.1 hypothetical protein PS914_02344 [Pseudomonas fluorescens]
MSSDNQSTLRLLPAPDSATVELFYRTFGDVLISLEKLRVQYFRNLNEKTLLTEMPPLVECGLQRNQKMLILERKQATGHELRAFVSRT